MLFRERVHRLTVYTLFEDTSIFWEKETNVEYGFEPVLLSTDRLELRPFDFGGVDDYYGYAKDADMSQYVYKPEPFTRRRAEEDVAGSILNLAKTTPNFAVVLDGSVIGDLWLRFNRENEVGELGFSIAKSHWGKGLASEASAAVIEWGFETEPLAKITARSDPRNKRALRVMEKLGMTQEGVLRSHGIRRGNRVDYAVFGILREEWDQRE